MSERSWLNGFPSESGVRSMMNAAKPALKEFTIPNTSREKSVSRKGGNELCREKRHHEDLIQTWKKTHSNSKAGQFKYDETSRDTPLHKIRLKRRHPVDSDQGNLDDVVSSGQRQYMSAEQMTQIFGAKRAGMSCKEAAEERRYQRAYLLCGQFFSHYNSSNSARPFMPPAFNLVPPPPPPTKPQHAPEWAHLLNPPMPYNQQLPPYYTGPPHYTDPPYYTRPLQPLQRPYTGSFPFTPFTNNTFNNCYRPTINSNLASSSNPQNELPRYITNPHMNDARSIEQLAQDNARGEDNNESASGEDEEGEEGEQHSSDGDYSSESE
ncbi:hypothetical protein Tco_1191772 [Tanacetum coccineum]